MSLLRRLQRLFRLGGVESELAEEMEFHRAMKTRELVERGLPESEAAGVVAREMGNMTTAREDARGVWLPPWMEGLWRDSEYALRSLRKQPGFAVVAIGTLAAAIGLNTSVFTVFGAVALRPWAVREPGRVVNVYALGSHVPVGGNSAMGFSIAEARFLDAASQTFEGLFAMRHWTVALGPTETSAQPSSAILVTANYFRVLGIEFERGRGFLADEDKAGTPQAVVVLSYTSWQNRFGGDSEIIGRTAHLDGVPFTVVGVASRDFTGTETLRTDLWAPLSASKLLRPLDSSIGDMLEKADYCCSSVAGRIRKGVPQAQAGAELEVLSHRFSAEHSREANGVLLTSTAMFSRPGRKGDTTAAFALMFAAVFLILLLACANVGNLLIARSAARRREIATRLSIGASRSRIVRQLLTESMVMGAVAGLAGLAIAYVLPPFVMARAMDEPANFRLEPDRAVLAFSLGLSVLASVLFGLAPALHATRVSVTALLKEQAPGSRLRLRSLLLGTQIALSVVLLVAAGLMMRGVRNAANRDPGFSVGNIDVISFELPANSYNTARIRALLAGLSEAMQQTPSLHPYGLARSAPFANSHWFTGIRMRAETNDRMVETQEVGAEYFSLLGIPLVCGRGFSPSDRGVILINETAARSLLGGLNACGKTVTVRNEVRQIVGVVKDTYSVKIDAITPLMYEPISGMDMPRLLVRQAGSAGFQAATAIAKRLDPRIQVRGEHLSAQFARHLGPARTASALAAMLGLLALMLASVGMFGVFAYVVRQRTQEIGIRMALGAKPGQILKLILGASSRSVLGGLAVGIVLSGVVSRLIERLLYGVSGFDPISYLSVCLILGAAALAATWVPARRAVRVEPLQALRYE